MTINRIYKHCASIIDRGAVRTSELLDRTVHHAETVIIGGQNYRFTDQIEI